MEFPDEWKFGCPTKKNHENRIHTQTHEPLQTAQIQDVLKEALGGKGQVSSVTDHLPEGHAAFELHGSLLQISAQATLVWWVAAVKASARITLSCSSKVRDLQANCPHIVHSEQNFQGVNLCKTIFFHHQAGSLHLFDAGGERANPATCKIRQVVEKRVNTKMKYF